MEIILIIVACAASLLAGKCLYHLLFDDRDDFMECLGYAFTPDFISLLSGEWFEDMAKSFKLGIFLWLSIGVGVLTYMGLTQIAMQL